MKDRQHLSSFVTSRPVAILMVFLAMVVFGYLSLGRLPVTLMPELTYPTLTVRTEYKGAAPEEVENDIGRPIEEALGVVGGLRKISSINRAGVSDVVLEFVWGTDMHDAAQDVLEKLDRVFLPDDAERPLILHYDPSLDPIMELTLTGAGERFEGEQGLRRLRRLAELQLKRELEPVKGVAAVRIRGGLEEELHVLLEEEALRRTGISIQQVIDRVAQENINVAGGTLKEGRIEYLVRTLNEYENLAQIEDTIVDSFDGRDVRVKDLGTVAWAHKEREMLTRTDGGESVQLDIYKEADANIVAVADRIKMMLGALPPEAKSMSDEGETDGEGGDRGDGEEQNGEGGDDEDTDKGDEDVAVARGPGGPGGGPLPGLSARLYRNEGAILQVVADRSTFIESSISDVYYAALFGGILAVLVLYVFLRNVLSTVIIGVSIPIAIFITFAPLNLMGVSLNIMSLGGLALGIGMLVDSSIVVLESIFRCREEGDELVPAAIRGTAEVRSAVWASTLTSIAVFFPMVFVEGIAGQAFGDLGFAVVFSLLASAAIALFFIPMLASRGGRKVAGGVAGRFSWRDRLWPFASWTVTRESFRSLPTLATSWARPSGWRVIFSPLIWILQLLLLIAAPVYWAMRFVLMTVVELAGKLLLVAGFLVVWTFRWVLLPVAGAILWVVLWVPKKLTDWAMRALAHLYPRVLRSALAHPGVVVLIVIGCFWLTWQVGRSLDSELLPEVHQGEFTVEVALPVGTPIQETDAILAPVEQAILREKEHIDSLVLTVGYDSANSQRSDEGEHTARFKVLLVENSRAAAIEDAVIGRLRGRFADVPDLQARIVRPVLFSSKTPIQVEIHGTDLGRLRRVGERAAAVMAGLPEIADVETRMKAGAPEVQIVYDRDRLTRYGLNIGNVARIVRDKVKGFEATRFNLKDRRVPILVRLAVDDRETVEDVRNTIVNPGGERPIPLAAVAEVTLGEGPSEVRRVDGRRVALIEASLAEGSLSAAAAVIEKELRRQIDWPDELTFLISGQSEEWERSRSSLWLALGLSIFLVYVIMAAQFESLTHPFVIMLTIPLAFVGTMLALKLLGMNLSIVVFLGMIMLAGIVVNNAIVLVDYVNTLRRREVPRDEAIITAGTVRLRPILMTTATTVLGLTPLALGLGDGAEIRSPMAIAVISGLITSTALTLIVIPSIYAMIDNLVAWALGSRVKVGSPATLNGRDADSVMP